MQKEPDAVTYGLKAFTDLNMMSRMKICEPDT